jgi:hypothetical protein
MQMRIPSLLLAKLYVRGSLHNQEAGFGFTLKNVLAPGTAIEFLGLRVDRRESPVGRVSLLVDGREAVDPSTISADAPLSLDLGKEVTVTVRGESLAPGSHEILIGFLTKEVGELTLSIRDAIET